MKKLIFLLPFLAISFLPSCKKGNSEGSEGLPPESDKTIVPIAEVTRQDWMKTRFLFEGTIHFTKYYDYIVDDYGFFHVLFGSKQNDESEPKYHRSLEEATPSLKYTDFTDGERVCFAWGERQSYAESMVNDVWKYDKNILAKITKEKGKVREKSKLTTSFITDKEEMEINEVENNKLYFTSDFSETKLDYSKDYYAYIVKTPYSEEQGKNFAMFFVEA